MNAQVDIYETEIYNRALREKEFSSRMYNLSNEQNPDTVDENDLDY